MKIIFMGTPNFATPILKALNEKYEVVMVVSQPNREKKKGNLIDTPVASLAKELNLKLIQPEKIIDSFEEIKNAQADVLVTAAYGQYISSKILSLFKKTINVHGSLLPYHRGGAPIQRSIMEGDEYTGVTIMEMAKKLDAGKIYSKKEYKIEEDDNSSTVFEKLSIIGRDLLMSSIEDIYNDINQGEEQDESIATYSSNITKEEELIDFKLPSKDVINKIRGLAMEPGAYFQIEDVKIKVFKAHVTDLESDFEAGSVVKVKKGIFIKTKDKVISLDLITYPGKKMMDGASFANGQKILAVGMVL